MHTREREALQGQFFEKIATRLEAGALLFREAGAATCIAEHRARDAACQLPSDRVNWTWCDAVFVDRAALSEPCEARVLACADGTGECVESLCQPLPGVGEACVRRCQPAKSSRPSGRIQGSMSLDTLNVNRRTPEPSILHEYRCVAVVEPNSFSVPAASLTNVS